MTQILFERNLQVQDTSLCDLKLITPPTVFEDFRGDYVEMYNQELYVKHNISTMFVQDDYATSSKHVLRGIHGDDQTTKLISCLHGSLYVIIVNNDPLSEQYRQWESFTLTSTNKKQILVPPKYGTSYLVMSDIAIFHYKQSTNYGDAKQFTIKWNDPTFKFWWPINNPITSYRDKSL